jgi:hypothetical protein
VPTIVAGDFEWDEEKGASSLARHAVNFDEAALALASDRHESWSRPSAAPAPGSSAPERRNPMSNASTRKKEPEPKPTVDFARAKRVARTRKGQERVSLRTIREAAGKTQADVARALGTDQGEISRIERRGDVRLSTMRRYAEAVGARLEVAFVFEATGNRALVEELDPGAEPVR